jgi:hypothetical protein
MALGDDYIPLKIDGPTKFGVMPLDGTSSLNFKEQNKWSHKHKAEKYKRVSGKIDFRLCCECCGYKSKFYS